MKSTLLLMSALVLASLLIASEAAAQVCSKDARCTVGGKKGTRSCENGHLGQCVADPDLGDDALCGGKACTGGKVCQGSQCVSTCKDGFTDCGGICRKLSTDPANCGACNNVCPSGLTCQQSGSVTFGPSPTGGQSLPVGSVCACAPPTVQCGGVCINLTNDPSNCGACGNVCAAPNTSCRNSQCALPDETSTSGTAGSTGNLPLDLFWNTTDRNGLPFNPDWRARSDPALVFEENGNKVVDFAKACPISDCVGRCVKFCSPGDLACFSAISECGESCIRGCTTVPVKTDSAFLSSFFSASVGISCEHANWLDATYSGELEFDDYSARGFLSSIGEDDDYTFNLTPTGGAGLAGRGKLHSEMSFLETVGDFNSGFWAHFRDLVDQVPGDDLTAPQSLFDRRDAIVTGLLGFDIAHGVYAELHPIYGMALRENKFPNPNHDCWAIVARNWGNEGFCSGRQHFLGVNLNRITFRLPQPGATAVTEISRNVDTNNSSLTAVSEVGLVQDGAEITFFLGSPEKKTHVNGEVCLRWALRPGTPPLRVVAPAPRQANPERDRDQHPGIELLTPAQRAQLARSLPAQPSPAKRNRIVPKRVPFVRGPTPATVVGAQVGPVDAHRQAREQAREQQIHKRVCELLRGHPQRPKICDQP